MNKLEKNQLEWFKKLEPFENEHSIPDIPKVYEVNKQDYIDSLVRCGAIPKSKLVVGATYVGTCRNSSKAIWNGKEFEYDRYKWGYVYKDTIPHFEDELEFDVFIPIKQLI